MDKAAAVEWFKAHRDQEIVIRMQGSPAVRVQGRTQGVEELDACSTDITETELAFPDEHVETVISFHDTTLGVHTIVYHPGTRRVAVSLPASIPYEALLLDSAAELEKRAKAEREQGEEPEFSPYELLH